jgi:hypothetical protein
VVEFLVGTEVTGGARSALLPRIMIVISASERHCRLIVLKQFMPGGARFACLKT